MQQKIEPLGFDYGNLIQISHFYPFQIKPLSLNAYNYCFSFWLVSLLSAFQGAKSCTLYHIELPKAPS